MDWGLAKETEAEEGFEAGEETDPRGCGKNALWGGEGQRRHSCLPSRPRGLSEQLDERSDIFLLGATLYALATCSTPFTGDDIYEILANAESGNFISPALKAPERELPLELCRIILQAMAYDQDERYQTVQELSEDVDALLAGEYDIHPPLLRTWRYGHSRGRHWPRGVRDDLAAKSKSSR